MGETVKNPFRLFLAVTATNKTVYWQPINKTAHGMHAAPKDKLPLKDR
ncbi:hypothetical protein [Salaquimonas pukyongi]|nr:hypothetical protein [Salaquimonas pukyongi]